MSSEPEIIFFQNTALSPSEVFPDTDVFVTKIYGMWTTPTNRHFLGTKITPGVQRIAHFYREPNNTFSVEVWPCPIPDDSICCPQMSLEEYAWVVGCSVDNLSPVPMTAEEDSRCIDTKLLQPRQPEPSAYSTRSRGDVEKSTSGSNGEYVPPKEKMF